MAILGTVCALAAWACSIYVGVLAIQRKQLAVGIISIICTIVGLIYGWTKANEWGIKNLMIVFTILFVIALALNVTVRVNAGM